MRAIFRRVTWLLSAAVLLFGLIGCSEAPSSSPAPTASANVISAATITPPPTPTPSPEPAEIRSGDQGEFAKKVQQRLADLGYLAAGGVDGNFGPASVNAFKKFLWQNSADGDSFGEEQLSLLFSEEARGYDPFVHLAPTTRMSFAELVGDNGDYDMPRGYPAADTYKIIVDIAHQVTMVYKKNAEGEYTVPVRYMLCSTGLGNRTPRGTFKMGAYHVRFSKFQNDGRYGQYWTQIRGAIYFHTMLYSKKNASSYLEDTFLELGKKASHGCVRLTVPDARWMWYNIAPGTICVIREGSGSDEKTAAIRKRLTLAQPPEEHLSLEAGKIPDTDNWRIADVAHDVPYVRGSQN